ncbi:MAG: lysine--tRNA ligase [Flavobacteriales bacterium]
MQLSEQEIQRRQALDEMRKRGIEPFPAALFPVDTLSKQLKQDFTEGKQVIMAGRLMSKNIMGKASFADLQDSEGRMQLYVNRDEICLGEDKALYNEVFKKLLDLGDFIGIKGETFVTGTGEPSVKITELHVLAKSVKPLPVVKTDKDGVIHDAFTDPELRYRMRYVDLVVNPDVKETFIKRSKIMTSMRNFLSNKGYLEVETPILQPIPGGAAARPFITHHNSLDTPLYLRIANELYLKRLIVGGFDGVFEFAKAFRNEGMDKTHNPEFTMMEMYVTYKDYKWMMETTEQMLETICMDVLGTTKVTIGQNQVDFKAPFKRVTMIGAIKDHTGIDIDGMDEVQLRQVCSKLNVPIDETMGKGKLIDEIFGGKCEGNYIQPTFITDYPIEMSPLCKAHRDNPELTERFELMVNGKELANAYSELNDPIDQRTRLEEQAKLADRGDDEAMFIDQDFLRALEYGMPPTSGIGIGIDRLTMFLTGNDSIQEVLLFPQMRPEVFQTESNLPIIELSDEGKAVMKFLTGQMSLGDLKAKSELSNKKWDRVTKELRSAGKIEIWKDGEALMVKEV